MSGAHSILAPSSAARRVQCSASTRAEAAYPQAEDSPEAAAGTAAHWGLAEMLEGRLVDVGQVAPNGMFLTEEMIEAIDLVHDDVTAELAPYGMRPSQGMVEQRVAITRIHAESWGTPDYAIWPSPTHLLVYDFKFGHRVVEVFENWQLIEYVTGLLDERGIVDDQFVTVTVKIAQPRAFHRNGPIRSWTFRASDIRAHINLATVAAREALGPNAQARVGPECRDCRARHACETLQRAAMTACDMAGAPQPFDLPPAALALEYRTLRRYAALLDARITGLEEQAFSHIKAGKSLPGLRVEHGAGREQWTVSDKVVIQIGRAIGVNVANPAKAMTPRQAVKAGLPDAVLAGIVTTPRGAAKLVEDDGARARKVFAA